MKTKKEIRSRMLELQKDLNDLEKEADSLDENDSHKYISILNKNLMIMSEFATLKWVVERSNE